MIKVLLVDDSSFIRKTIKQMLSYDPEIQVIDEACDGKEAIEKTLALKPDVITMDIIMPGVDGIWALEEIMKQRPTPVLLVSSIGMSSSDITAEAFSLGVIDIVTKPDSPDSIPLIRRELIEKIKAASKIDRIRLMENKTILAQKKKGFSKMKSNQVVVIVTSAGGPPSLYEVISKFSDKFYAGVVVAQHLPATFVQSFVGHLQKMTSLNVRLASKGDLLNSREVLFSPTDSTLELHRTKKGAVTNLTNYQVRLQPDIDKVIISCAKAYKAETVLVVLSGLGNDGVKGAEEVKKYGGKVIVEDETTAGVFSGMPLSVIKSGFYDTTCPSYLIAEMAERYLGYKSANVDGKNFLVKGLILKNMANYLKTNNPEDLYNRIMANLSENARNTLIGAINSYNYYPGNIYNELSEEVFKQCNSAKPDIIETIAYDNAKTCFQIFKQGVNVSDGNIEHLTKFLKTIHKIIFPEITWDLSELNLELKYFKFIQKNGGYNTTNSPILAKAINGWTSYFFEQTGISLKTIENEIVQDNKNCAISCTIKWQ